MEEVVIVSAARTAIGKSPKGSLRETRPDDLAAEVLKAVLERAPGVAPEDIDDVILGCATPEAEQGLECRPHRRAPGRFSAQYARPDHQPLLRVRSGSHRYRRRQNRHRAGDNDSRGWNREHDPRSVYGRQPPPQPVPAKRTAPTPT